MITVNANTKISTILKQHPEALEAIVSISPKLEKLRNPILRKLIAGRASIDMASKICGSPVSAFFEKLQWLGFEIDIDTTPSVEQKKEIPAFLTSLKPEQMVVFDVRPIIESGTDPFNLITEKIKTIQKGQVLKIVNSFEPVPLMTILKKQGYEVYADIISENLVETYFFKFIDETDHSVALKMESVEVWSELHEKYGDKLRTIDVRQLEIPQPMLKILEALEHLPSDHVLLVYHKRLPVFLLPELSERKFDYRINEISDNEVHILIFKA
jgi:uncharacterized protein (DUF2249 family)